VPSLIGQLAGRRSSMGSLAQARIRFDSLSHIVYSYFYYTLSPGRLSEPRNDQQSGPPEFYDDDIPLLWLGAAAPAAYLEEVNDDLLAMGIYGLLQACGTPSENTDGTLKRSARHAMNLLKWLIMDWKEPGQKKDDLNLFARSFLGLEVKHYVHMQFDLHCIGDDRGGAKEDACQIIVQILTKHTTEDGESPSPVMMEELLNAAKAQQEFELWTARHCAASVQDAIKKNAATRQSELALQQRQDALAAKSEDRFNFLDESGHGSDSDGGGGDQPGKDKDDQDPTEASDDEFDDADDVVAAMRKRNKKLRKELKQAEGRGEFSKSMGVALRWEDSQLAREQRARMASAALAAAQHETVRDSQEAVAEALEREEERAKVLGKDPLGIVNDDEFDLSNVEKGQAEQMERTLAQLQEELQSTEGGMNEKLIKEISEKKESLESFVDKLGGIEAMENMDNLKHSIMVTHPNFDPLLFLTLVHRKTDFNTLMASMDQLSSKFFALCWLLSLWRCSLV